MKSLMTGLMLMFVGFRRGLHDPEFRAIGFLLLVAVAIGTFVFKYVEGWSWLDSAYFSVVSLTTVGDANLAPTMAVTKIFSMIYSLIGIGLMLAFLSRLTSFREESTLGYD
jgi:hypothetical protein